MTRVLVVHHDADMADQESDWLRAAGYSITECAGPQYGSCPVLRGEHCAAIHDADVLVYDVWAAGDTETEETLIERLRDLHPETPIVLTAPGVEFDWVETDGKHGVVALEGAPSAEMLRKAVATALESVGRVPD
jgi:DNA-binding NtrC family response regulator